MMASIEDWAAKAARRIRNEMLVVAPPHQPTVVGLGPSEERIAAIIATFAAPLVKLVEESRRGHYHCEDSWYCCGKCNCGCRSLGAEDHEHDDDCWPSSHKGDAARMKGVCNCGADAYNEKVNALLEGKT